MNYGSVLAVYPDMFFSADMFFRNPVWKGSRIHIAIYHIFLSHHSISGFAIIQNKGPFLWVLQMAFDFPWKKHTKTSTRKHRLQLRHTPSIGPHFSARSWLRVAGCGGVRARSLPVDVSAHEAKTVWPKTQDSMMQTMNPGWSWSQLPCRRFPEKKKIHAHQGWRQSSSIESWNPPFFPYFLNSLGKSRVPNGDIGGSGFRKR